MKGCSSNPSTMSASSREIGNLARVAEKFPIIDNIFSSNALVRKVF
jgi:hypothetical protein